MVLLIIVNTLKQKKELKYFKCETHVKYVYEIGRKRVNVLLREENNTIHI